MREKKNEFVFTIGFKKKDPEHIRVVKMLNEMDEKNQFIVNAILCYVDSGYMNMRPWDIQPAVGLSRAVSEEISSAYGSSQDLEDKDELKEDANRILQSLQGFRRT